MHPFREGRTSAWRLSDPSDFGISFGIVKRMRLSVDPPPAFGGVASPQSEWPLAGKL